MYANAPQSQCFGGVDVMSFDSVIQVLGQVKPDVVINCIGIVKQIEEANDPVSAYSSTRCSRTAWRACVRQPACECFT